MKLTREEAHWSSFRIAVVDLQHTLRGYSPAPMASRDISISHARRGSKDIRSLSNGGPPSSMKLAKQDHLFRRENPQSALEDIVDVNPDSFKENPNPLDEVNHKNLWDDTKREPNQTHQHLELIGLEQVVNKNVFRNKTLANNLSSPAKPLSHASHTTNALSMTEQQLAETRLKLAMTESERDELEFQLMQR
mmetsp:Transcript_20977/g.44904  ORF Transcript_20977/g.44904 Transcript_20977/m.44904 type:complete len:192 (+) Transcript_20977:21-596(+)|eukprot:CAMPEP_0172554616 /NCGR_PEP_ID=MMETSP1067-20121228/55498_1 /TAXON_ID=265564 ORGANISM="Thalassiosira punctigera, Strain Tpunct2005C2" /NCGR_SAMPLE_ID=MMETSP1067 /ASSEMBLY_ACC=CAM_ASM_000444 /LENGTH=191 /DNA_ID=CAMNT_0013343021 /DNA_START=18 /DNA_END=593 /DNA_ORIENTATION=+